MADTLTHRGPDAGGTWVDSTVGVGLGHRRLAIIELSPLGAQPMLSACGRFVAVFNGEIYNFRSLRAELEREGAAFRGHSDTEVLVEAIAHWGLVRSLERLNGMFAFAVWDRRERLLHLARDRFGEKPLYYGWCGEHFLFGSELKALRAHPAFRAQVDAEALTQFFRYNYVPAPRSIFRGILKLPAGSRLSVAAGRPAERPAPETYWSALEVAVAARADPLPGDGRAHDAELETLLREAVGLRMEADVPLGAFLSGGIDSSLVVALMQAQSARPVRTFTIGFEQAGYDEAPQAAAVARHLGTEHTELYVTAEEALAVVPRLPEVYDEPFADSSQVPTHIVSGLTRRFVTVSLSGDGGDELFGGYNRYFWGRRLWRRLGAFPLGLRRGVAALMTGLSPGAWDALAKPLLAALPERHRHGRVGDKVHRLAESIAVASPDAMYRRLVSHWMHPEQVVRGGREPAEPVGAERLRRQLPEFTERMMYADTVTYLPDDILVKVDRAAMAVSLETRVPLLDHRLFELAWRLPVEAKVGPAAGKLPLRRILARHLPEALFERPKTGFGIPVDSWLRGPLRAWAEDLLAPEALSSHGLLEPGPLRAAWAEHLTGRRNNAYLLWGALMFQAWWARWMR